MIDSPDQVDRNIEALRSQAIILEQEVVNYRKAKLAKEQEIQQLVARSIELKDSVKTLETTEKQLIKDTSDTQKKLEEDIEELRQNKRLSDECVKTNEELGIKIRQTFDLWQ